MGWGHRDGFCGVAAGFDVVIDVAVAIAVAVDVDVPGIAMISGDDWLSGKRVAKKRHKRRVQITNTATTTTTTTNTGMRVDCRDKSCCWPGWWLWWW